MRILIAPLHYVADKNDGSEYTRAYDYVNFLSSQKDIFGDVIVGYMNESRLGNLAIKSFFRNKPGYISNFMRFKFVFWVYFQSLKLQFINKYDVIWHNGPFALNETFSLISLLNFNKVPFVVGPINTPHSYIGEDESRSMGNKSVTSSVFFTKLIKFIDNKTYFLSKIFTKLSSLTLKKSTLVLAKELQSKRLIDKIKISNSMVFNMGLNIPKHKKAKIANFRNKVRLLNVSYLVERKRTIDLIYVIDHLVNQQKKKNILLTIVGDGPQKSILVKKVVELKLEKHIQFIGYVKKEKILEYYSNSDIFVSASQSDTMPAMYFEAISTGLPMITYQNHSILELIKNGIFCKTVKMGDFKSMANEILSLSKDTNRLKTIGEQNYDVYNKKYDFKKRMKKFIAILKSRVINI